MENYWIIGIGGTAMASLAVCLKELGHQVGGSDEGVYPPMSQVLIEAGIRWSEGYSVQNLPSTPCQFVVGNAIPRGNPELEHALDKGLQLISLPELIRSQFLPGHHSVVVSGTHGKTTTTNLLALLFKQAGLDPGWLIGGKPDQLPRAMHSGSGPFITEGDEYDTVFYDKRSKFLHYWPRTLVINHIEFDHGDIFDDIEQIKTSFKRLLRLLPTGGSLLVNADSPHAMEVAKESPAPVTTFGQSPDCDLCLLREECVDEYSVYHFRMKSGRTLELKSPLQGTHNARNIAVAILLAEEFHIPDDVLKSVVSRYRGPARRMDFYELADGHLLFDDFAHHPTAIRETLKGLRQRYPELRLTVLFEPRSNTSVTNVMQDDFMDALSHADRVALGPLHRPWKYVPESLFDFELAADYFAAIEIPFLQQDDVTKIPDWIAADFVPGEILLICSNGNFYGLRELLLKRF